MNRALFTMILSFAIASPLAIAQSKDDHSAHHPQGQAEPATGAEGAPPTAPADGQSGPSALDQGMRRLQDLMTQIDQSNDPVEREAMLHEHMMLMLEQIKVLHAQLEGMNMAMMTMGGNGQMGAMGGEKKKSSTKAAKTSKSSAMMCSEMMGMHKIMEKRLDMLQLLLEQSIKHAHMRESADH